MISIEEHKKKINEHLEEINNAIEEGIEKKPVTIGFNCSACALQFLELYLHLINKIPIGKVIKHDWFKKPKQEQKKEPLIERKMPVIFPRKDEIYSLIYILEEERNSLVYGKPSEKQIKSVLRNFLKIKEIFLELFEDEKFQL
ncbi:hypothetical protein J4404_03065 [Candidatus Woesearchaeota archaeon]|nr:hypothetical protein [Candidatus Woesearchaeota archaeon]